MRAGETTTGDAENSGKWGRSRWWITAWLGAMLILLLPLIAMQFTGEVNWSVGDFVFAGALLFGSLGTFEFAAGRSQTRVYRAGAGIAIVAATLLVWINGAVGITDSAADGLYFGVVAVGLVGAILARFRARGMARALFATALAQALIGVLALIAGMVPAHNSAIEILGLSAFFVALFGGSAWLFREAAGAGPERGAV